MLLGDDFAHFLAANMRFAYALRIFHGSALHENKILRSRYLSRLQFTALASVGFESIYVCALNYYHGYNDSENQNDTSRMILIASDDSLDY